MTGRLYNFARFWYDFVVGDDWRIAVAVVAALALTFANSASTWPTWTILPGAVAILLPASVYHAARRQRSDPPTPSE